MRNEIQDNKNNEDLKKLSNIMEKKIIILLNFTKWIQEKIKIQKDDVSASCNDYLKVLGYISLGFAWFKMMKVSIEKSPENKNFYDEKINTAKYFFDKIFPRIDSHFTSATTGSKNIMNAKFN